MQGYLPTIHPNLLCSLRENGRRGLDSCHPMWPVIALKVHTVVRDEETVLCCGCPQRDPMLREKMRIPGVRYRNMTPG